MGNLRLQNELPRCPGHGVDTVDSKDSYPDHVAEEPYEEDYIRTESYFSSASQHVHVESTQPMEVPLLLASTQDSIKRPRIASDDSNGSNDDRDTSIGSANVSLPLSDSIIPDSFDTSAEVARDHLGAKASQAEVSSSPTIMNLSNALSRITLRETNNSEECVGPKMDRNDSKSANRVSQGRDETSSAASLALEPTASSIPDANQDVAPVRRSPGLNEPHTSTPDSHPQTIIGMLSSRRSRNRRRRDSSRESDSVTGPQPSRSCSRRRKKRQSRRSSVAISDLEDCKTAECTVDGKNVGGRGCSPPLTGNGLEATGIPVDGRGLSSSRWAPRASHSVPTPHAVVKGRSQSQNRITEGVNTSGDTTNPGTDLGPVQLKLGSLLPSDLLPGNRAVLDSSSDSGVKGVDPVKEQPSALHISTQFPIPPTDSHSDHTNRVPRSKIPPNIVVDTRPVNASTDSRQQDPTSFISDDGNTHSVQTISHSVIRHNEHHVLKGATFHPGNCHSIDPKRDLGPATGPIAANTVPVGQLPTGTGRFLSNMGPRDIHNSTPRALQSTQHMDALIDYWQRVHEACGDLRHIGLIHRSDTGITTPSILHPTGMGPINNHSTGVTGAPTFQSSAPRHLSSHYDEWMAPQSQYFNGMSESVHDGWFVPPQRQVVRMEMPPERLGAPIHQAHRQIRPVISMPVLKQQHSVDPNRGNHHLHMRRVDLDPPLHDMCSSPPRQHLRLPIIRTSEEGFHSNPPPPHVMNIAPRHLPAYDTSVLPRSPQVPESDFNSRINESRIRATRPSVAMQSSSEKPSRDQDLVSNVPPTVSLELRAQYVEPSSEVETGDNPSDNSRLDGSRDTTRRATRSKPFLSTNNKPPARANSKDSEALSWRSTRNVSAPAVLKSKRSMPTMKYVPPPARALFKTSQTDATPRGPSIPAQSSPRSSRSSSSTVRPDATKKSGGPRTLGDGAPRLNSPPPLPPASDTGSEGRGGGKAKENEVVCPRFRARSGTVSSVTMKATRPPHTSSKLSAGTPESASSTTNRSSTTVKKTTRVALGAM
ncbi:hypothetical protein PQX77_008506 [Marasmius sp. AFHP31]|nr:hypothetical protein PQX77_008506 [Marasmius sp. AFHP31]